MSRSRGHETKPIERVWLMRMGVLLAAVLVAGFTDDVWAGWFDDLIKAMGDGSTAAALVGWLAGFPALLYVLFGLAASRRRSNVWSRTWLIGVLLLIPFITLQPSRTRRSASIADEYWYLGSFFDTYSAALITLAAAAVAGGLCVWQSTRGDTNDFERSNRWLAAAAWAATAVLALGTLGTLVWVFTGF